MNYLDLRQLMTKMKAVDPRVFFSCLAAAVLLFVAMDIFLVMRPQISAIAGLGQKASELKAEIDTLSTNKQRMAQFRAGLDEARENIRNFKAMVHTEDAIPSVFKVISTVANQYGLKIDQLVPQKNDGVVLVKNEDGSYGYISIMVRARGGYHDFGRFLSHLEKEGVFWQIDGLDITADQIDPARHVIRLQMKVLILGE